MPTEEVPARAVPDRGHRLRRMGWRPTKQFACLISLITVLLLVSSPETSAQVQPDGTFGFSASLIFKFNLGVGPIAVADLDGDGDHDLAVMDNQKAQLVLLFQDPKAVGAIPEGGRFEDPDGFVRHEITMTQRVSALSTGDLDVDGKTDLVLHSPGSLEVRWGGDEKPFSARDRFRTPDSLAGSSALVVSSTVPPEVFLLAKRGVYQLSRFSREKAPERMLHPGSADNPRALFVLDLDRDGLRDLLTVVDDRTHPYRLRLGVKSGFGPESMIEASMPISITTAQRGDDVTLIAAHRERGRFEELTLDVRNRGGAFDLENPDVHPLDAQGLDQPRLAVGDLDGDGDSDVAVTNRKDGTILLLVNDRGELRGRVASPTVRQLASIAASDLDGDGSAELVVASAEEKVVGLSRLKDSSLSFPKKIADTDSPKLAVPGRFLDSNEPQIAVLGGKRGRAVSIWKAGTSVEDSGQGFVIESNTDPRDLRAFDLDNDGQHELMVFIPFEAPQIYARRTSGDEASWVRLESPGTLEAAPATAVNQSSNGDLLIAAGNHMRRVRLSGDELEVIYQVNGTSGTSRIGAAFEAKLDGQNTALILLDKGDRSVNLFDTENAQPKLQRSIPGPYESIRDGAVADLDGDGSDELILLGDKFLTVLDASGRRAHFESVFTHQCNRERGSYIDITSGDLNGDGNDDILISEGVNHFLEIYKPDQDNRWTLGLAFPVYESNTFRGQGSAASEPRSVLVSDVTGDGLSDAIIVVNDRVIIYPQDR